MKLKPETVTPEAKTVNFLTQIGATELPSSMANLNVREFDLAGTKVLLVPSDDGVEVYARCPFDSYDETFKWIRAQAKKGKKVSSAE